MKEGVECLPLLHRQLQAEQHCLESAGNKQTKRGHNNPGSMRNTDMDKHLDIQLEEVVEEDKWIVAAAVVVLVGNHSE